MGGCSLSMFIVNPYVAVFGSTPLHVLSRLLGSAAMVPPPTRYQQMVALENIMIACQGFVVMMNNVLSDELIKELDDFSVCIAAHESKMDKLSLQEIAIHVMVYEVLSKDIHARVRVFYEASVQAAAHSAGVATE